MRADWKGFDAGKISQTDASASIAEEQPWQRISEKLSDADGLETINNALAAAQKETKRLEERLADIARVKNVYDAKELESRKETCAPCNGTGTVKCARCRGSGSVTSTERVVCPACGDSERRGSVKRQVRCNRCRGSGQITKRCGTCGGKGRVRGSDRDAFGKIRLDTRETCGSCGGSGKGFPESCPDCSGFGGMSGMVEVWSQCRTCRGQGTVSDGSQLTCPVCDGKGNLKCERCGGRGFTYRPKE